MRPDDLRLLLRQQPFAAFRLYLTDGMEYEIRHPEMVSVLRSTIRIGIPAGSNATPPVEQVVIVALIHIVRMELLPPAAAPAAN